MKATIYILFLLLSSINLYAQTIIVDSVYPIFKGKLDGDKIREIYDNYEIATPIRHKNKGPYNEITLSVFHSKKLYVGTALNLNEMPKELDAFKFTNPINDGIQSRGGFYNRTAVPLFDSANIIVTAYGINPENKSQYRFRILENKKEEILPWHEIKIFSPVMTYYRYNFDGTEQKVMAYLGQFSVPVGNSLTVEVRNIKEPDTTFAISAVWIKRAPAIIGTFTPNEIREFLEVYKYQWKHDFYKPNQLTYYGDIELTPVDSLLKTNNTFRYPESTVFFYLKDKVKTTDLVEYNLIKNKDSSGWIRNTFDPNVIRLQQLKPGQYVLLLRYAFQRQTVGSYSFTVKPAWYQTNRFYLTLGILSVLSIASIFLFVKNYMQKRKLEQEKTKRQITHAEIKSIKSQFNPNFVFNALASIQGLITKNDIESAHQYLNDFSALLRNSLKESEKEFITLSKDILLMDNYLKLEQLRFGFQYNIRIDNTLNKNAIEIPVLLLQPAIENAIKHGISGLYENGNLVLSYTSNETDLIVTVQDNGKRYDHLKDITTGHGLKLTEERIALINRSLKEQRIDWKTESNTTGTKVEFIFKNWLL